MDSIRRVGVTLAVVVFIWVQSWQVGWADAMQDAARQGQAAAEQARRRLVFPQVDPQTGALTLFPGTPNATPLPSQALFPGQNGSVDSLTPLFGDNAGLQQVTGETQQRLPTESSTTGEAYRTMMESRQRSHPDLSNDPIWGTSDQTLGAIDQLAKLFSDCAVVTKTQPRTLNVHVPDYQTCERVVAPTASGILHHDYELRFIRFAGGEGGMTDCGPGCVDLYIGKVGDNYWDGNCQIFEQDVRLAIADGSAIQSAVLEQAVWDDHIQIVLDDTLVWQGPDNDFPPETAGTCELKTSWNRSLAVDLTRHFQTPHELRFLIRVSVAGKGEGYARIRLRYDLAKVKIVEQWYPDPLLAALRAAQDGFCQATVQPLDAPPGPCVVKDDWPVCAEQLAPPPVPGLPVLATRFQVDVRCEFYLGRMNCWTDPQGLQHCPEVTADTAVANTCTALEQNPACGFVKSECIQGAQGASGECYAFTDRYDCGYTANAATTAVTEAKYQCAGPVRCLGEECYAPIREHNQDFARATAALQAAQTLASDANCAAPPPGGEVTCELFKGDASQCKKALGGVVNCCKSPGGVSLGDYITLLLATLKLDSAMTSWQASTAAGQAVQGAWMTLRQPIAQTWASVTQPFTSVAESIGGTAAQVGVEQAIMNGAAELVGQVFGTAARDALFTATTKEIGGQVVTNYALTPALQAAASVLSVIMWVYMVYQIAMILAQIIWECEVEEFELGAKRELKSCHYIGSYCASKVLGQCVEKRESYCCFNSPLSRILQEQIRPQLGMSWGEPDNPNCSGIPVDQLSRVDWNKVNLDEWVGILATTGRLPTADNLTLDRLTGSGNLLNTPGSGRQNTQQRTQPRIDQVDTDRIRNQVGQDLWANPLPR